MKQKLVTLLLSVVTGVASASTSTFNIDWAASALTMTSGTGEIQFFGDYAGVLGQIVTDYDTRFDFGRQSLNLQLGGNQASGTRENISTKMVDHGNTQIAVESFYAATIDLAPGAHGVFKIPYAWALDTKGKGDLSAFYQYSFETVNFGVNSGVSIPTTIYQDGLRIGQGTASSGRSFVEVYLDNTTDDTLRFALYQNTAGGAEASGVQSAIPESAEYTMFGAGLALLGLVGRRRKQRLL